MRNRSALAIYLTHNSAENAIKKLQKSDFDIKELSIISRDSFTEEDVIGYYNIGNRVASWGSTSALFGGIWGMIFGSVFFIIPDIQPIVDGGPIFNWLLCTIGSAIAVSALSAFCAALVSFRIPENSAFKYKTGRMTTGKFVLVTEGRRPSEVQRAKAVLDCQSNVEELPSVRTGLKVLRA